MSGPEQDEVAGHDPHYLAHVATLFEARLVEESVDHWFAITPMVVPHVERDGTRGSRLSMMVAIWRKSGLGNATVTSCEVISDYWNLTDDTIVDHHCTQIVRSLDQAFHEQLRTR